MEKLIQILDEAQKLAISIKPKTRGFPIFAEVLRRAGVHSYVWFLPSCQSIYNFETGHVVQQMQPLMLGAFGIPKFSKENLKSAIQIDQNGDTSFHEFLLAIWNAGVISYEVDFLKRKVTYFSVKEDSYTEEYPQVELKN